MFSATEFLNRPDYLWVTRTFACSLIIIRTEIWRQRRTRTLTVEACASSSVLRKNVAFSTACNLLVNALQDALVLFVVYFSCRPISDVLSLDASGCWVDGIAAAGDLRRQIRPMMHIVGLSSSPTGIQCERWLQLYRLSENFCEF